MRMYVSGRDWGSKVMDFSLLSGSLFPQWFKIIKWQWYLFNGPGYSYSDRDVGISVDNGSDNQTAYIYTNRTNHILALTGRLLRVGYTGICIL